jgi:hypothetical protein
MKARRRLVRNREYKLNQEVVLRQEEDEAILFDPETSDVIVINSTGRYIWELLVQKLNKEEILAKVMDRFEVTLDQAEEDLDKFISDLKTRNFIT